MCWKPECNPAQQCFLRAKQFLLHIQALNHRFNDQPGAGKLFQRHICVCVAKPVLPGFVSCVALDLSGPYFLQAFDGRINHLAIQVKQQHIAPRFGPRSVQCRGPWPPLQQSLIVLMALMTFFLLCNRM